MRHASGSQSRSTTSLPLFLQLSLLILLAIVTIPNATLSRSPQTQDGGTISPSNSSVGWTAGPFTSVSSGPDAADCSNSECDHFTFTVSGTSPALLDVDIRLDWNTPNNDFDFKVTNVGTGEPMP